MPYISESPLIRKLAGVETPSFSCPGLDFAHPLMAWWLTVLLVYFLGWRHHGPRYYGRMFVVKSLLRL